MTLARKYGCTIINVSYCWRFSNTEADFTTAMDPQAGAPGRLS